jgi:hypothetical protein
MPRVYPSVPALAAIAALAVAGCGDDGGGGDDLPASGLADLASPGSLVFVEAKLEPTATLEGNVDSIVRRLTAPFDFAMAEPWLGDRGAVAFERVAGGELSEPLIAVQTTEPDATQAFVDRETAKSNDPSRGVSYEGVDFEVGGPEDNAIGVIGEALVSAGSEKEFKAAVDASKGESLGDEAPFEEAIAAASGDSFAAVYLDLGAVLEQSEGKIDPRAREVLRGAGIDLSEATAVASVMPLSEQVEIELSSDLGGEQAPAGDRSKLLGTLPASSLAAVASLGKTPISAFVDGPAALSLAESLVPRSSSDFWDAAPYLKKISYIGVGVRADSERATAKLIAGVGGKPR